MSDPWAQIEPLYHAARLRPAHERAAFLTEACGSDEDLRREVESLLAEHAATGGFLTDVVPSAPALAAEMRIGVYQIVGPIGAGGMGEVYRARDTKLDRDVAIKVLPQTFATDMDRLARLQREARLLAALNHPNIAQIYGLEESDDVHALVMELVDGETLADRIARGPIRIDESLLIASQIADALEAAHEKGIIHRDLKPSNVAIASNGIVKVLDFGLAKLTETTAADAPQSSTIAVTDASGGVAVGTAGYMSPEQARGRPVDKRTDIWAFGCVLYEMLSGRRAFAGDTTSDRIAAILEREPDWSLVPAAAPPGVRRALRRCLDKDPAFRLHDIADARLDLDDPGDLLVPRSRPRALIAAIPIALAVGAGAAFLFFSLRSSSPGADPVHLTVELGADASMPVEVGPNVALSRDGSTLTFVALTHDARTGQLYVRHLNQLTAIPLAGTEDARNPFFSPDGRWIGFFDDVHSKLKKVAATGGDPVTLCDAPSGRGGEWLDDDSIVIQVNPGTQTLARVAATGGIPRPFVSAPEIHDSIRWPQLLPGGKAVLYTVGLAGRFERGIVMAQPLGGRPKVVLKNAYYGRFVETGHILYLSHGTLFAAPFDVDRLEVTGPAAPIVEGVSGSAGTGGAEFAVSRTGVLMYVPSKTNEDVISWMDPSGATTVLRAGSGIWTNPVLSPDGDRVALEISDGTDWNVWVYDVSRETATEITFEETDFSHPVWTPDGRGLAFGLLRDGATNLYWSRADGSGVPQRLTNSPNRQEPWSWHPSGKFLSYFEALPSGKPRMMILPMSGDTVSGWKPGEPYPLPFGLAYPAFSPDGRWIAYVSGETGRREVFVRPFPVREQQVQISTGGADFPQWSPAKKELLFRGADNRIMVVGYEADGESFRPEKPRLWSPRSLPAVIMRPLQRAPFAVHPSGERIALFVPPEPAPGQRDKVVLVFNFLNELRQLRHGAR
jgi:serine/threonine protein kinase/Tol biopolymer transport system component